MSTNNTNYAAIATSTPLGRPKLNGLRSTSDLARQRTKILLLGMRRAGKTSIQQVLFNNMLPKQTFYLETTMRIAKIPIDTIIPLELWDCPANTTVESLGTPLSQFSAIIFVIDIRDLYNQPISKLVEFIVACYHDNPDITLEVFVHKAEKLQEDDKLENFRQIHERVSDRLLDLSPDYEQMQLNFHLTSVYDHSVHEAFSRVLHKLIDSLPYLEELLNVFCANSQSPKAFLFDNNSRLYVATDASPVDSATHNLCCDFLHMLNSFGPLYRSITANPRRITRPEPVSTISPAQTPASDERKAYDVTSPSRPDSRASGPATPNTPTQPNLSNPANGSDARQNQSGSLAAQARIQTRNQIKSSAPQAPQPASSTSSSAAPNQGEPAPVIPQLRIKKPKDLFYPSASTTLSMPSSHSNNANAMSSSGVVPSVTQPLVSGTAPGQLSTSVGSTTVTYHLITRHLALLALVPTSVYLEKRGLLEYNVVFFREGVQEICDVEEEARGGRGLLPDTGVGVSTTAAARSA